jgi:hypothetical protein
LWLEHSTELGPSNGVLSYFFTSSSISPFLPRGRRRMHCEAESAMKKFSPVWSIVHEVGCPAYENYIFQFPSR